MFNPTRYYNANQWEDYHHPIYPVEYAYSDDFDRYHIPPFQPLPHTYATKQKRAVSRRNSYQADIQRYYDDLKVQKQLDQEEEEYYYDLHNYYRQHGVRSASPQIRKERKRRHHQKRAIEEPWLQPNKTNVPFVVGQPMMNPMIHYQHQQQILGACATDPLFMNGSMPANVMPQPSVPMIQQQPYFLQIPTTSAFGTGFQQQQQPLYPLLNPFINNLLLNGVQQEKKDTNYEPSASSPVSDTTAVMQKEPEAVPSATTTVDPTPKAPIRRRRSLIETALSSFSGNNNTTLGKSWGSTSYVSLDEALGVKDAKNCNKAMDSLSPRSSVSNTTATTDESAAKASTKPTLSRKTSLKLAQKANALQMRQYIWCYKPQNAEAALWAAFDVKNQAKLDKHYSYLLSKRQQMMQQQQQQTQTQAGDATDTKEELAAVPGLPTEIFTLSRQSQLNGPVMISLGTGTAWCLDNDSSFSFGSNGSGQILLDIACLPRQENQFVVSNEYMAVEAEKERSIRRSKSVDGLATKLLNTVLKW